MRIPQRPRKYLAAVAAVSVIAVGSQWAAQPAGATAPSGTGPGGVCTKNSSGNPVNCPRPLPSGQLPAASRDTGPVTSPVADPAVFLDTRTWTSGGGNTYPGADVPFGMIQWGPDTLPDRSDGGGYTFADHVLAGYSLTHLSGPGCLAAGDVPILPMTGGLHATNPASAQTSFSHRGEVVQAGYYTAFSNYPNTIKSQFSATPHSAIGQFTFPRTTAADLLLKLRDGQRPDTGSSTTIVSRTEVAGSVSSAGFCDETSRYGPQKYRVYFDITFSRPFTSDRVITMAGQKDPSAVFLTFNTTSSRVVDAKVAISYVSTGNARRNWQAEDPGWNLGRVRASAQASWNKLLREISVWGGSVAKTQEFYSLLYKTLLQPDIVSDVNGQYLGSDYKVHSVAAGQANQYGMFSGWDMYHSQAQLIAMLDPPAASDMAQSLVNYDAENGILPQWGYLNTDNYVMNGDPADSIIADFYAFGATAFDTSAALAGMLRQADTVNRIRPGSALEAKYGYLPLDGAYGCCHAHGEVSSLLEYDTADLALSFLASALGDSADATRLQARANNWSHLFDPANKLVTSRRENGTFLAGVGPSTGLNYIEGDAYEYLWDVPNNYAGLFARLGGTAAVVPRLVTYLSRPGGRGVYANLADEFDLGEQNALDYAGDPAGTQRAVASIRNVLYKPGPYGMSNNDDLGAESSQFIWEMLGMYPENPGSGTLVFASPGFPHAVITLPAGPTITISAPGASTTRFYVDSLTVNGSAYSDLYIPFATLAQGATLNWALGTTPTSWGSAAQDAPPSYP